MGNDTVGLTGTLGLTLLGLATIGVWFRARRVDATRQRLEEGVAHFGWYGTVSAVYFVRWMWFGGVILTLLGILGVGWYVERSGVDLPILGDKQGDFYFLMTLCILEALWLMAPVAASATHRLTRRT